jgi:hypothetical protein
MKQALLIFALLLAGCGAAKRAEAPTGEGNVARPAVSDSAPGGDAVPTAEPIPPGRPGGLADDRTPVSEAPFSETSGQGAANVVQVFYALIEQGKLSEARRLWSDPAAADSFARSLEPYGEYHAQIGAPGRMEGAAGSSYVDVQTQAYGRLKTGRAFATPSMVTLRRVNDVPGSTGEQRKWHIVKIVTLPVTPRPGGRS